MRLCIIYFYRHLTVDYYYYYYYYSLPFSHFLWNVPQAVISNKFQDLRTYKRLGIIFKRFAVSHTSLVGGGGWGEIIFSRKYLQKKIKSGFT
jgi:hypothetical protein